MRTIPTILREEKTWRNNIRLAYIHVPKHLLSGLKASKPLFQPEEETTITRIDR